MPERETYTDACTCVCVCAPVRTCVCLFCTHKVQDGFLDTLAECSNNKLTV